VAARFEECNIIVRLPSAVATIGDWPHSEKHTLPPRVVLKLLASPDPKATIERRGDFDSRCCQRCVAAFKSRVLCAIATINCPPASWLILAVDQGQPCPDSISSSGYRNRLRRSDNARTTKTRAEAAGLSALRGDGESREHNSSSDNVSLTTRDTHEIVSAA
jgi:hypothetical protein